MRLALTGCSWCYVAMGSCYNGFVFKLYEIGVGAGSCSNNSVHFRRRLRCKLSRLKRAGEVYETGSDWMLLVLGNGFVFKQLCSPEGGKQLCSAPEAGHRTPEMQTEQAEKSRRTL